MRYEVYRILRKGSYTMSNVFKHLATKKFTKEKSLYAAGYLMSMVIYMDEITFSEMQKVQNYILKEYGKYLEGNIW